jgi:MFS family permease
LHSLLLPIRGAAEGFSTTELGLIGTGWATGFVLGCLTAPIVVRRVGHIRAFSCAAAGAAVVMLLNGLLVMPLAWIILRACSGFLLAGAFMIIESWLNERATNESRGTIFAVYLTVTYLAITAGQFGFAAGDSNTASLFMVGAILFCLSVLPTSLSTAASPKPLARARLDLRRLFANSPVAFVTVALVGVINGAFGTLAPVFGTRIGLSTTLIALMMGITVVSGALTQVPAGRLSDRTDRRYVIAGTAIAAALAGIFLFALDFAGPTPVLVLAGFYGALTYPIYGLAVAQANDYTDPGDFVAVSGGLLLLYGVGTMVGPLAGSTAMTIGGPTALFTVTATAHLCIAGYAIYRTTRRAPVPEDVRDAYRGVPGQTGTPQTAALDPRAEDGNLPEGELLSAGK